MPLPQLTAGGTLWPVRQVKVLQPLHRLCLGHLLLQRSTSRSLQCALPLQLAQHRAALRFQCVQALQLLLELPELGLVQPLRGLLAVARDEGQGGAVIEQAHCRHRLASGDARGDREHCDDVMRARRALRREGVAQHVLSLAFRPHRQWGVQVQGACLVDGLGNCRGLWILERTGWGTIAHVFRPIRKLTHVAVQPGP